ncbi:MAG TPA: hypothetical protein EYN66_02160 [Myxococcales bacterium]|nr:hypothetical protein [Myxococcales bacterium]
MSKNKPKETIEYVIRLQDKERQMIESAIGAYQINRIATPLVDLLNDVTGMATVLSLLALVGVTGVSFAFVVSDDLSVANLVDAFVSQRDQAAINLGIELGTSDVFGLTSFLQDFFGVGNGNGSGGGGGF